MLSENYPEQNWKTKLNQADFVHEMGIGDKEAAWAKLQERLHPLPVKRQSKKWWYAAAAIALVAGSMSIYFVRLDNEYVSTNFAPELLLPETRQSHHSSLDSPILLVPPPIIAVKKIKDAATNVSIPPPIYLPSPGGVDRVYSNEPLASIDSSLKESPDTVNLVLHTAAPVNSKPKLRVIHANELGDTPPSYPTAGRGHHRVGRIPLFQQEMLDAANHPAHTGGIQFFKSSQQPN